MKIFLDCLPCVLRQVLAASRMATDNVDTQRQIMDEAIDLLAGYRAYQSSPHIVQTMHQMVNRRTGVIDPFADIKARDIQAAMAIFPLLEQFLASKQDQLYWALKIAATGNIIDSAIYSNNDLSSSLEFELAREFAVCDIVPFQDLLKSARNVLIIGDNAGETVFDRILIGQLKNAEITYAVRGEAVINDVTAADAIASGLDTCATIVSSGCSAPGAILSLCSDEFNGMFNQADLVISKGQGNYEALSDCPRPVFFLLKAKCRMLAEHLNVQMNDYVFRYYQPLCK